PSCWQGQESAEVSGGWTSESGAGGACNAIVGPWSEVYYLHPWRGSLAAPADGQTERTAKNRRGAGTEQIHRGARSGRPGSGRRQGSRAAVGARPSVRSLSEKRRTRKLSARAGTGRFDGGPLARQRTVQGNGHADFCTAAAVAALAGVATGRGR